MSEDKVVDVAVGVLIREDGRVLLASRPEGKPWAGYWEFPGGKLEDGETVHQALVRELDEELGVRLADSFPWFVKEHRYEHAHVRLHFRRSRDFFGEALSKEGQDFGFYAANERTPGVLLPIDQNILNRVDLPDVWEDSTTHEKRSAMVVILDEIEYCSSGGGKQRTEEAGEQPRAAAAPAKSASNGEMPGNFTGFEPFGGVNSFFDE